MAADGKAAPGIPFQKGISGNPGGRPIGLERMTREILGGDIRAVIYVQRCISLGFPPDIEQMEALGISLSEKQRKALEVFPTIKCRDVNDAGKLTFDRGWGKARQTVDITGDVSLGQRAEKPLTALTDEQLKALAELDVEADEDDLEPAPE